MNDFLSVLLDRSLERAPVLRPRRLSRFEPFTPSGSFDSPLHPAEEIPAHEALLDRRSPPAPQFSPLPAAPEPIPGIVEKPAVKSVRPPAFPPDPPPASAQAQPATLTPASGWVPRESVIPAPLVPPAQPARPLETVRTVVERISDRRGNERPAPKPVSLEPAPRPLFSGPPTLRPAASPALRPVLSPRPAVSPRAESSGQPPVIHVSIGRIDVRATHTPSLPPARAARPAEPKLNLEQYLASRAGNRP
jgi:hypothetical protein